MNKVIIYTESKFITEKKYVFNILFHEILGLEYEIFDTSVSQVYKIVLPQGEFIEFSDDFFTYIPESIGYCKKKYLPTKIVEFHNVVPNETVPFFYGSNRLTYHGKSLFCGGDIVASSFFMLSRWEEYIVEKYDRFGRFPEKEACAVKFGIIQKPVVHIYAEMLRIFLKQFGFETTQKHRFKKVLTHDIDSLYKWGKPLDFFKTCIGDLFKRVSIRSFKESMQMRKKNEDPYDVFDFLMSLSEKNNTKSVFYFLYTKQNESKIFKEKGKKIIQSLIERKHEIGIHTNYFLESDYEKIRLDKEFYSKLFNCKIQKNRQHFLKFRIPQTFRVLENVGITQDSSMYYTNFPGFRTGMCIEHDVFDCENRKVLKIRELPITLMDVSLLNARKYDEALDWIDLLLQTVKRYNGTFVCLWHNSNFNSLEWKYLDGLYKYIVEKK